MTDRFADVAATLAKGAKVEADPQRLVLGLAHFSQDYLSVSLAFASKPSAEGEIERVMLKAAKLLNGWLPMYALEAEADCPDCVEDVLTLLPDVIEFLERDVAEFAAIPPRAGGPRPDLRRPVCAAVCAEAWRVLHDGAVEPYSQHLQDACEEYWQACGNLPTGKSGDGFRKNWQEYLLQAVGQDNEWIRERFSSHQR